MITKTRLMVSVRNTGEARMVASLDIPIIDVKEPRRGPLGRADAKVVRAIGSALSGKRCLSVALGELVQWVNKKESFAQLGNVQFAKIGLAGMGADSNWAEKWIAFSQQLLAGTMPVAVIYADYAHCAAPEPHAILDVAESQDCRALLIDTFDKSLGSVFEQLPTSKLTELMGRARELEMLIVLAGKITRDDLPQALELQPDIVAIRGAACAKGRADQLSRDLTEEFLLYLNQLQDKELKSEISSLAPFSHVHNQNLSVPNDDVGH